MFLEACEQLRTWRQGGKPNVKVTVAHPSAFRYSAWWSPGHPDSKSFSPSGGSPNLECGYLATLSANHARCDLAGVQEVCREMLRAPDESAFRTLLSNICPPRASEADLNPQLRAPRSRGRLVGMQEQFKFLRGRERISCTRFSAFFTFFGWGLQVEKGVRNAAMYLKTGEVEI